MKPRRTKSLTGVTSLRLTPDEEAQVAEASAQRGLTKSEWLRQTILRTLKGSPDTRLILAEVIGARAVVVSLLGRLSNGIQITDEVIKTVIDQVNLLKSEAADKRMNPTNGGGQ
jgi:hypothetical protein